MRQDPLVDEVGDLRSEVARLKQELSRRPQPADGWREALEKIVKADMGVDTASSVFEAYAKVIGIATAALANPSREPDSGAGEGETK